MKQGWWYAGWIEIVGFGVGMQGGVGRGAVVLVVCGAVCLCCGVLWYIVLCFGVLCCVALRCVVLCCGVVWCGVVWFGVVWCGAGLYGVL